jgi:hypothetical protein
MLIGVLSITGVPVRGIASQLHLDRDLQTHHFHNVRREHVNRVFKIHRF